MYIYDFRHEVPCKKKYTAQIDLEIIKPLYLQRLDDDDADANVHCETALFKLKKCAKNVLVSSIVKITVLATNCSS